MISEIERLKTLKTIAEVLNQSYERNTMLQAVLDSFLEITHFEAGWIFLGDKELDLVADAGLPEALLVNNKQPMCGSDSCYCLSRYKQDHLDQAINIITCKRLEEAINEGRYDTGGFKRHATVPLQNSNKRFGVFNVTAKERDTFIQDELELLQSVADQMVHALERIELHENEEKRSKLFKQLNVLSTSFRSVNYYEDLKQIIQKKMINNFSILGIRINTEPFSIQLGQTISNEMTFNTSQMNGKMTFYCEEPLTEVDKEVLTLVLQHTELTIKEIMVRERQQEMVQIQEREALAQDLHDTVNQLLYSMKATLSAIEVMNKDDQLNEPISDLNQLSKQALVEMRELIENKKSQHLSNGLISALKEVARTLQINLDVKTTGTSMIPPYIEEALYKIGREAIHNIYKHAKTEEANLQLIREQHQVTMTVKDEGIGLDNQCGQGMGLRGIQDRVDFLNGTFKVDSIKNQGVTITIQVPIKRR